MKHGLLVAGGAACVAWLGAIGVSAAGQTEVLFDGTSLDAFDKVGDATWTLKGGAVEASNGERGYLITKKSYGDYRLVVEFWVTDDANSGVFLRCASVTEISPTNCYEVNIFDQRPDPAYATGAIVDVASPREKIMAGGKWNTYEIVAKGAHLTITLDGVVTVDVENAAHASGPIALQYGGGTVRFRKVTLMELD